MESGVYEGLVLLNYHTAAVTFALPIGANYVDQDGAARTGSVSLPAHTGMILKLA